MARFTTYLAGALVAAAAATAGSPATAQPAIALSGVVQHIWPHSLDVWEPAQHTSGTWFVANPNQFRIGERITGTGTENTRGDFYPSSISVVAMPSTNTITLTGTVQRIGPNSVYVWQNATGHTAQWIVWNPSRFQIGERITASGTEDRAGQFFPYTVRVIGMSTSGTITLTGTVQSVRPNALIVWENAQRRTGTWIVGNAARFRLGERVTGTGTEDGTGRFYPSSISVL
ncbi:MAG TPA: hypothetical protein VGZ02_13315 [Candidatus Baltobacteraceae bacterium]|jgi:hypothetical protein|nr:hypothetical protein [Candidatus Baltobacteraceae bacterium]